MQLDLAGVRARVAARAVLDALVAEAEALPVGLPWEDGNEVGPIVSARQYERVTGFIASGREEGARLATGGDRPADPALANGVLRPPTVFDGVDDSMRIAREEIFGPVMSVFTWSDHEEVLARANALPYGLTAAIVTSDLDKAMETAERVEAGYVWINSTGRYLGTPYGGWKPQRFGPRGEPGRAAELYAHQERAPALVTLDPLPPEL